VFESILDAAIAGAARGAALAPEGFPGPSSGARIAHLRTLANSWRNADEAMDFLYGVIGTGIESADVCAAVFGIFLFARGDVMLALRMGASAGGDTDTIAALGGALCAAFAGAHNIPRELVDTVVDANRLEIGHMAASLSRSRP
jgi:ADP-ribosylglycohydrolase